MSGKQRIFPQTTIYYRELQGALNYVIKTGIQSLENFINAEQPVIYQQSKNLIRSKYQSSLQLVLHTTQRVS